MRVLIVLVSTMLAAPLGYAGCVDRSCMGIGIEVVKSVYPSSTGDIYLEAPDDKTTLNCTLKEGQYMVLQSDHPLFREIYSTVLSALTSNKRLQVRIVEGSDNCQVSYVRMWS